MKINIKATGIELTPAVSDYIYKKIESLEKYLGGGNPDAVAQVEVGRVTEHHRTGEVFKAEIHLTGGGFDHYALAEKEDVMSAIDAVKDEIAQELRKTKGKRETLMKRGGQAVKNVMKGLYSGVRNIRNFKFRGFKTRDPDEDI